MQMLQYLAEDSSQKGCEALFSSFAFLIVFASGSNSDDRILSSRHFSKNRFLDHNFYKDPDWPRLSRPLPFTRMEYNLM